MKKDKNKNSNRVNIFDDPITGKKTINKANPLDLGKSENQKQINAIS